MEVSATHSFPYILGIRENNRYLMLDVEIMDSISQLFLFSLALVLFCRVLCNCIIQTRQIHERLIAYASLLGCKPGISPIFKTDIEEISFSLLLRVFSDFLIVAQMP